MSMFRSTVVVATLLLATAVQSPGAKADDCYHDWAQAAVTVARERLVTVEALIGLFSESADGKVVRTSLCLENGRYVYKIVLRSPGGALRSVAIDARRPARR
jgi:uncharacterized membrane protein YkoI